MNEFWKKQVEEFQSDFFGPKYTKQRIQALMFELAESVEKGFPHSMIRMGDLEADFIGYKRVDLGKNNANLLKLFSLHLGMDLGALGEDQLIRYRDEFTEYFVTSEIPASQWRSTNVDWSKQAQKVIEFLNDAENPRHIDCVIAYEMVDRGLVFPLLEGKNVLLVGHPADKLKKSLVDGGWRKRYKLIGVPDEIRSVRAVQTEHDNKGTAGMNIEKYWQQVVGGQDFDIALIAASVPGKIIGGRIKEKMGKVALDLGYGMQQVALQPNLICPVGQKGRRGFKRLFKGRSS